MLDPFIRVRNSKKAVTQDIVDFFPPKFRRFIDATPTDLSVFSAQPRSPKRSLLNITDPNLKVVVEALQTNPVQIEKEARNLWEDCSREEFESVAASDRPVDTAAAAAQVLYLNQLTRPGTTSYDPDHKADRFPWEMLEHWAERLDGVKLLGSTPLDVVAQARPTDLVLLDTAAPLELEPALQAAAGSPGLVVVIASGGPKVEAPQGMDTVTLPRRRPGAQDFDVLYVPAEEEVAAP